MPDQRELVRARFTRTAQQFAEFSLSKRSAEADKLVELAAPRGDELALDLACGPGTFTRALARAVRAVHGLDITPALLEQARAAAAKENLANCVFECGDAYALPYPAAKFDLASCAYTLHHLTNPAAAIAELARVVRPNGRIALVDLIVPDGADSESNNAIERARDASHATTLRTHDIHALCASAGFRVTASELGERTRSFDDWMQIAGWHAGDAAYAATRRLLAADVPADRSGFHARSVILSAAKDLSSSADFEFIQTSLFVVAVK
jgi:ubiquinone/menaquinone biosynthesis C-methylase UbiE